jgi:hypothetical protein
MVEPTRPTFRSALRTGGAIAVVLVGALALSGCVGGADKSPSSSPSATKSGGAVATTPTPTPTPTDPPTPVTTACNQVLTPDQVYAFNPNFGTAPDYSPKAGTLQKQAGDWKGATCGWINQTSKILIEIAIAQPPASAMEGLKNAAVTNSQPVPTYGVPPEVEGYFKPGTAGEVQIFRGAYWIVATSPAFFEPGDAAPLMQNVLDNLPQG